MTLAVRLLLGLALALLPEVAMAHPPPIGVGGFWGGFLHPLFVPAHVTVVAAVGLLIGQQGWGRAALAAFVSGLLTGLGALALAYVPLYPDEVVLGIATMTGALVAWARPLAKLFGVAFATVAGLAIALDSPPDALQIREANLMLLGTGLGAMTALIAVAFAASRLMRPWQRIGVRIAGSWIAASAILALALEFAR